MRRLLQAAVVALMLLPTGGVFASPENARLARVMWSAFQCSIFSSYANDEAETERLFYVGYDAGKAFFEALEAGEISDEEWRSEVPIGVSLRMGGPTVDFTLGRIYAAAAEDASDEVVKEDSSGLMLAVEDWNLDDELQMSIGKIKYEESNCVLF